MNGSVFAFTSFAMATCGLQTPATAKRAVAAAPQCAARSYFRDCSSSSTVFFRRSLPSLYSKSGCKGRRSLHQASGAGGHDFVVRASTALVGPVSDPTVEALVEDEEKTTTAGDVELLACPVCFQPLSRKGIRGLNQGAVARSGFQCLTCKKAYSSRYQYLDLTVTANAKVYSESRTSGIELFRNPLVSYAYERGWRQNFQTAGFPGPDEEVKMAQEYFKPTYGGVLLDVSCGSGLFTRRFAKLDLYSAIVAIDFSESMLRQAYDYIKQDDSLLDKTIALVRADVARMPFSTGSVDAVHAGAALHCWPSPAAGVAEISRILRPGGVFVATTFLAVPSAFGIPILDQVRQAVLPNARQSSLRYWEEGELEDLMRICGLVNYKRIRRQGFIMISAQKPERD